MADAITAANSDTATGSCIAGSGNDTIVFTANVTLSGSTPQITSEITFSGNDYTLDGADSYRLFVISAAPVTINNLTLNNGNASYGGAIYAIDGSSVTVSDSVFSNNEGNSGGAIYAEGSGMTLNDSVFSNNEGSYGGAIYASTTLTISKSSFSGNSATNYGGAVYALGFSTISNSSFSGNSATADGGAIYQWGDGGMLTLTHVTIAGNSAAAGNGVYLNSATTLNMRNSLIKDNGAGAACYTAGVVGQNVGNLISDNSCSPAFSGDPKLGDFHSGGYYPLQSDSPAIDVADSSHCLGADQLGTTRPQGSGCDIGAFEVPDDPISPTATAPSTNTPVATDTPMPIPTDTPEPTATDTPAPTATDTPAPTATNTPEPGPIEFSLAHGETKTVDLSELGSGLSWSATIKTWHVGAGECRSGNLGERARNKLDGSISGATMSLQAGSSGAHILRLYVTGTGAGTTVEQEYKINVGPVDEDTVDPGTCAGSPTPTATDTPSPLPTATLTATNTALPTATNTPSPVPTDTPVPTATNTPSPVPTATNTPSPVPTDTPVPTATNTPSPVPTDTPVPTATNTPSPVPTDTPVPTATNTPSPAPTDTPVPTATNTPGPVPTDTPVPTATNTPSPVPTDTPVPTATNTPVPTATDTPAPGLIEFSMAHGETKTVDLSELGSGLSWSATIKTWHVGAGECRSGNLGERARNKLDGSISGETMSLQAGNSGAHILRLYVTGTGAGTTVEQEYKVNVGPVDDSTVDPGDC